jgi:hypothetical protein
MLRRCLAIAVVATMGCSGGNFAVASQPDADEDSYDSGAVEVAPPPDARDDSVVPSEGGPSCVAATASSTDIYVDKSSLAAVANGSIDCPFRTILDALAFIGPVPLSKRTVHVKGGLVASPAIYNETAVVVVHPNVNLLGESPLTTRIAPPGGPCTGVSGNCMVVVQAGGILDGFTVNANGPRNAIATTTGAAPAVVRNTIATGATGDGNYGILVTGDAEIGPGINVVSNAKGGLLAWGTGTVHVVAGAGAATDHFDLNGQAGIEMTGGAVLHFDGGICNNNVAGVRFTGTTAAMHVVKGLTAQNNTGVGVGVAAGNGVTIRHSTLLRNRFGLTFAYNSSGSTVLDLGTSADAGNNVFGGATVADHNVNAGVCVEGARGTGATPAQTNRWSILVPVQQPVGACDGGPAYADIWYHTGSGVPGSGTNPLDTTGAGVGP